MPWIAPAAIGGATALSGLLGAGASKHAANTQAQVAQYVANLQYQMYQQTAQRLQPWVSTGTAANASLGGLLGLPGYSVPAGGGPGGLGTGGLTAPFQPTMEQLSATPGYQFTLQQGKQAIANQAAGAGQGAGITPGGTTSVSGPEGKGLINYATGLASTTYQQQFQNYWTQLNNVYNMLSGASATGANAAAGVGQAGTTAAGMAGNALTTGAAASAAGTVGAANAIGTGLTGGVSNALNYSILTKYLNTLPGANPAGSGSPVSSLPPGSLVPGLGSQGLAFGGAGQP
jgi:hypothetical protein